MTTKYYDTREQAVNAVIGNETNQVVIKEYGRAPFTRVHPDRRSEFPECRAFVDRYCTLWAQVNTDVIDESSSGGEVDPTKPLKLGSTIENICCFKGDSLISAKSGGTAIIRTNIEADTGFEVSLCIRGNSCIVATRSSQEEPDGVCRSVDCLLNIGYSEPYTRYETSGFINTSYQIANNEIERVAIFKDLATNRISIGVTVWGKNASFNVDYIGGIEDKTSLSGWDVAYINESLNDYSVWQNKYNLSFITRFEPQKPIINLPTLRELEGAVLKSNYVYGEGRRAVIGLMRVVGADVADAYAAGCLSGFYREKSPVNNPEFSIDYTISVNREDGTFKVASSCFGSFDSNKLKWVSFKYANRETHIGILLDQDALPEGNGGFDQVSLICKSTNNNSYVKFSVYDADSSSITEITDIPANSIVPIENIGKYIATGYQVRNSDGSLTDITPSLLRRNDEPSIKVVDVMPDKPDENTIYFVRKQS